MITYFSLMTIIGYTVIVASVAAWLLTLAKKWRILEWIEVRATKKFIYLLVTCDFCLSWWTAWVLVAALFCVTGDYQLAIVPFVSTCITRRLL